MISIPSNAKSRSWSSLQRQMRVAATIVLLVFTTDAFAQERFNSPDEAVTALIAAAKAGDPRL